MGEEEVISFGNQLLLCVTLLQPMGQEKVISLDRKIPLSLTFIPTNGTGGGYHVWTGKVLYP
jgi:hypothetical protein